MKFLDIPDLTSVASRLNSTVSADHRITCWLEGYSVKSAGPDKKALKEFTSIHGGTLQGLELLSPPQTVSCFSAPVGWNAVSKRTLYYLTATLNNVFPDYEFGDTPAQQFCREPALALVAHEINMTLLEGARVSFVPIRNRLWQCLETHIELSQCEIYSYIPVAGDPFAEDGTIWSFNYFFVNPKLKRVVFFACKAESVSALSAYELSYGVSAEESEGERADGVFDLEMDLSSGQRGSFAVC